VHVSKIILEIYLIKLFNKKIRIIAEAKELLEIMIVIIPACCCQDETCRTSDMPWQWYLFGVQRFTTLQ